MSYKDKYGVEFSDDKKSLIRCPKEFKGEYIIPEGVTSIGNNAFSFCKGLTSIEIPSSVTSIGDYAFYVCKGLTSIEIPSSVTSIGEWAFKDCTGLTSIVVDANNKVYDSRNSSNAIIETATNRLFLGCSKTRIPSGVTSIGDYAFSDCTGLTSIDIPSGVTSIGKYAFYDCKGLTSIEIPSSVTSIGIYAFYDCKGLTSIEIPSSVTSIGYGVFSNCKGLTSIVVDKENKVYDSRNNCNAIIETATNELVLGCSKTRIPSGVMSIGYYAFSGHSGLTSIEIPSSVTSIGGYAFSGCTGLTSIIINYSGGCDKVRLNYFNHLGDSSIKYVTISDGITLIPEGLFADAESLEMVYLSNTLTALPDKTFYNCSRLEELKIPDSVMSIGNECIVGCNLLKDIVIPEGVETLGNRAICDCEGLESVNLPSTVKRIGTGFLSDCPNLKQVIIPSGSKLKFLQLGLDSLKDKLVERGSGSHRGNVGAQNNEDETNMLFTLGKAYELGIGVGKNIIQAVMMYTQAADRGHAEAAYRIAEMYRSGENLPQNMESAIKYYKIAANSNFMDSASIVKDYEESLREEEKRRAEEQKRVEEQRRVEAQKCAEERACMEERRLQPYYLFFDTETTGLPARYDVPCSDTYNWPRMVQLSWIVTDRNGTVIRKSDNIIKPFGFTIPADASNLHDITTSKALLEGKDLRTVVEQFMGELANVSYVVGHNVEFDTNIVGAELYRLGMSGSDLQYKQSICTMKSTVDYCQIPQFRYGSYKFPKLQELHKKLFGYEFDDAHNSMCDVEATMKCFFELVSRSIIN